jgi:hypothetical protein
MKKNYFTLFALLFGVLSMTAQDVYYSEDFENGLPADWTISGEWVLTDAAGISSQYFQPAAHTMFLGFNDDAVVNGTGQNGRVTTGPIDLTAVTGTKVITFESFFPNGDFQGLDETARISVSTDSGATWTELSNLEVSGFEWLPATVVLPDAYTGQIIHLAFDYDDGNQWNYGWCIDDIVIQDPSVIRDASMDDLNKESFFSNALVGAHITPGGIITNNGIETINSVDLNVSINGTVTTETISGLDIGLGGKAFIEMSTAYTMINGTVDFVVSVSNVNGAGADDDTSNDVGGTFSVTSITPHPDRGVLVEEATGTWCTWCPRGAVYMDGMTERYPGHFVGVAVHNQDPMVLAAYNSGITGFPGFQGFPSVVYERTNILDPSAIEAPFLNDVVTAPVARLNIGATFDDATRELVVSVDAEFLETVGAGYKLNAVLIEDGLTGTGSDWDQINAYSGGGNGPMDFYTVQPGAVPAEIMVYDHVGRALLGGFNGVTGSLPDAADAGTNYGHFFDPFTVPAGYNLDNVHIVAILLGPNGQVANAWMSSFQEAVDNGLFTGTKEVFNHDLFSVSPNPFAGSTNISLSLEKTSEVSLQVFNSVGQLVAERNFGELSGNQVLPYNDDLSEGVYFFHIRVDGQVATQRVNVVR